MTEIQQKLQKVAEAVAKAEEALAAKPGDAKLQNDLRQAKEVQARLMAKAAPAPKAKAKAKAKAKTKAKAAPKAKPAPKAKAKAAPAGQNNEIAAKLAAKLEEVENLNKALATASEAKNDNLAESIQAILVAAEDEVKSLRQQVAANKPAPATKPKAEIKPAPAPKPKAEIKPERTKVPTRAKRDETKEERLERLRNTPRIVYKMKVAKGERKEAGKVSDLFKVKPAIVSLGAGELRVGAPSNAKGKRLPWKKRMELDRQVSL